MLSQHATSIERLVRAAARASVPVPADLGSLSPAQLLHEAVSEHRPIPAGTTREELIAALDQYARKVGFEIEPYPSFSPHYLQKVLAPSTPLEVLSTLRRDQADLALALARVHRNTPVKGTLRDRHQLFGEISPYMDALDALDVVADGDRDVQLGSSNMVKDLTADDASTILAAIPADARFHLRYGPLFSVEDTLSMLRFGGRAGAVLAMRAGTLEGEAKVLLVKGRTAVELLEIVSATHLESAWEALAEADTDEVAAALAVVGPSRNLAGWILARIPLSREGLLRLLVMHPELVRSRTLPNEGPNRFSSSLLREWAARMSASRVKVSELPSQYQQEAALALKGVAPRIKDLLDRDSDPVELSVLLRAAHEVFGGEPRLWARLATAAPSSPFGDRELSLVDATNRYWDRWNAAAARHTVQS